MVLDANVLAPHGVCDLFLRLAEDPRLITPRWSDRILDEVRRTQIRKLGFPEGLADYWRHEVNHAFPEAMVEGYEFREADCANHPKDRHVLAAGIHAHADAIVTFNVRDFPRRAVTHHGIKVLHPDALLCVLFTESPEIVAERVNAIVTARGWYLDTYANRAGKSLPEFANLISSR